MPTNARRKDGDLTPGQWAKRKWHAPRRPGSNITMCMKRVTPLVRMAEPGGVVTCLSCALELMRRAGVLKEQPGSTP